MAEKNGKCVNDCPAENVAREPQAARREVSREALRRLAGDRPTTSHNRRAYASQLKNIEAKERGEKGWNKGDR
jgi:hypothetical protein